MYTLQYYYTPPKIRYNSIKYNKYQVLKQTYN
jgi:hypothetical protein